MITVIISVLVYALSVAFLRWVTDDKTAFYVEDNLTFKSNKKQTYTVLDFFLIYFPVINTLCSGICFSLSVLWIIKDCFKRSKLFKK